MSANFLSLPSELRNNIYEQLLVVESPFSLSAFGTFQRREKVTLGLLRANKTIYGEASFVLYARNRFDLSWCDTEYIESFLARIGRINASCITYICINFPEFDHLDLHDITLEEDSSRMLARLQSDCTGLNTLQTSLNTTYEMEVRLDRLDNLNIVVEALALVDAHFRGISSLQNIIVEVYEEGPSDFIRNEEIKNRWTVNTTEGVEVSDFDVLGSDFDEFLDNDHDHYNYSDFGEYDIDNDSDFWRRAAD
ncbi:hypothetical protein NHQ30_009871 [Ciborinia camelliae]|nr:hypothetical protein NHQ30_009871 [Ciborinia camelliae]